MIISNKNTGSSRRSAISLRKPKKDMLNTRYNVAKAIHGNTRLIGCCMTLTSHNSPQSESINANEQRFSPASDMVTQYPFNLVEGTVRRNFHRGLRHAHLVRDFLGAVPFNFHHFKDLSLRIGEGRHRRFYIL